MRTAFDRFYQHIENPISRGRATPARDATVPGGGGDFDDSVQENETSGQGPAERPADPVAHVPTVSQSFREAMYQCLNTDNLLRDNTSFTELSIVITAIKVVEIKGCMGLMMSQRPSTNFGLDVLLVGMRCVVRFKLHESYPERVYDRQWSLRVRFSL